MIIGRPKMQEAISFFEGGIRAAEGVVCLTARELRGTSASMGGTGWLLTPRLVLTILYSSGSWDEIDSIPLRGIAQTGESSTKRSLQIRWSARDTLTRDVSTQAEHRDLAEAILALTLLELPADHAGAPLSLNLQPLEPSQDVYILQHSPGAPLMYSAGELIRVEGNMLQYDASTLMGSSGAPVFDGSWKVIGLHVGWGGADEPRRYNYGVPTETVIDVLRRSPCWQEIAAFHRVVTFVDVNAASKRGLDDEAVYRAAAVRWSFDPGRLHAAERRVLASAVADPEALEWSLRASVRRRVLREAGSLLALREARGAEPLNSPEQRVIDRILRGPPFALDEISEEELPIWIPAVRWFGEAVTGLPSGEEITAALDARRHRGRLARAAGVHFAGREQELARLREWLACGRGPMVVSGAGGVGKSALIASFVLESSPPALSVWLDFDSASIAPDDAPTVLAEVIRQLVIQAPGLHEELPAAELEDAGSARWVTGVRALGSALSERGSPVLLLVLDSFEAAQYAGRHDELWPFLEALGQAVASLKILVSGRVPLPDLSLGGHMAQSLPLRGLDDAAARAWLAAEEIVEPAAVETILSVTRRIPLNLVLAADLVRRGDGLADLVKELPERLVEGYLYRRILRRVSEAARPLAHGSLVLRRLTEDMVVPVLGEAVGTDARDVRESFARLAGELTLVEGTNPLRHRPDVRNAVLSLLEAEDPAWVRAIEEKAVRWYEAKDTRSADIAAELVYHRLRLGDVEGAKRAWVDGVAARMGSFALEEVPEPGRTWLAQLLGGTSAPRQLSLVEWEVEASRRIRDAVDRELWRAVPEILKERADRTEDSPLVFLDAYARWRQGDGEGARQVLASADEASGPARRDRAVLQALLAEVAGDRESAAASLASVDLPELWAEREEAALEMLAVTAARIRLAVDLDAEERFNELCRQSAIARRLLLDVDVVLPSTQAMIGQPEISLLCRVDTSQDDYDRALERHQSAGPPEYQVMRKMMDASFTASPPARFDPTHLRAALLRALMDHGAPNSASDPEIRGRVVDTTLHLAWLAWTRRLLCRRAALLTRLFSLARSPESADSALIACLFAQAAPFVSASVNVTGTDGVPLHEAVEAWFLRCGMPKPSNDRWTLAERLLGVADRLLVVPFGAIRGEPAGHDIARRVFGHFRAAGRSQWSLAAIHLLLPSPLPSLVKRLAELSE